MTTITLAEGRILATLSMTPSTPAEIKRALPGATPVATIRAVLTGLGERGLVARRVDGSWVITPAGTAVKAAVR